LDRIFFVFFVHGIRDRCGVSENAPILLFG
jgi:hypothetical protein